MIYDLPSHHDPVAEPKTGVPRSVRNAEFLFPPFRTRSTRGTKTGINASPLTTNLTFSLRPLLSMAPLLATEVIEIAHKNHQKTK